MAPDRGLATKKMSGVKAKKDRLTYALCANADGTDKLPPYVIGKAQRPRCFNKKSGEELGFDYGWNAKAWMTGDKFKGWAQKWNEKLRREDRHVLLFVDNFSGHILADDLSHVHIEFFQPNLTAHVQPLDQGVIRCFKAHYRKAFISRAIDNYDAGTSPGEIYSLNQLQAMRMAQLAWDAVEASAIAHCWEHAGILPDFSSRPIPLPVAIEPASNVGSTTEDSLATVEKELEDQLDQLVQRGALQRVNRMTLQDLLNPADESVTLTAADDNEICDAVMAAHAGRQQLESNGCDEPDSTATKPRPTRTETLAAAAILEHYLEEDSGSDARELEGQLAKIRRRLRLERTRELTSQPITNFFTRKSATTSADA